MTEERRRDYPDLNKRIMDMDISLNVLANKVENLQKSKNEIHERMLDEINKLSSTVYGNGAEGLTSKVKSIEGIREEFARHTAQDRWVFGVMITIMVAILAGIIKLAFAG